MAFSATERVKIRKWMGYPIAIHNDWDPTLEHAIDRIEQGGTAAEDEVRALLAALLNVDTKITAALDCLATMIVDKVQTDGARSIGVLRQEGRRLMNLLGRALNVTPMSDAFSSGPIDDTSGTFAGVRRAGGWP